VPIQLYLAALGAESRVCYPGNTTDHQPQWAFTVLLPLAVNSKSERKVDSLPPLRLVSATFGTPAHFSDRSAKFLPTPHSHSPSAR
jgi:hypothetical protein